MTKHIENRTAHAKSILTKLQRFNTCTTKTKLKLYTSIVRPVIEYPPIPLHTASISQLQKLQAIQNTALRWATNTHYPSRTTNEQLHIRHNMQPINIRLHNRAKNIWTRLQALEDPLYTHLIERHADIESRPDTLQNYRRWPRSLPVTTQHPPPPYYTRPRRPRPQRPDPDSDTDTVIDDPDSP